MIYLDVTSAAASPVNMGVHRTIRGLHRHLAARHEVTPLRWDPSGRCYARLSPREEANLRSPFASYREAASVPGQGDWGHWLGAWRDARSRPRRRVPAAEVLAEGNTLLLPDLSWDPRIRAWAGFAAWPGRKVAIFHDAMPLRLPGQADSHDALFAEYVRALAHLDLVICISREVEADLLRYWAEFGCTAKPTCVLPWPVPFDEARPAPAPNFGSRQLVYVSRLKLRKNHLVLFDACEKLWARGETFALDLIGVADAWSDTRRILRRLRALARRGWPVRWRRHISDAELGRGLPRLVLHRFSVAPGGIRPADHRKSLARTAGRLRFQRRDRRGRRRRRLPVRRPERSGRAGRRRRLAAQRRGALSPPLR